ncbi:hypothetical protein Vadar_006250 [Vaccinium darrowii]|uniref:Uncharacterized protein n=1 Tax=Vaccinium darrowii TaxID=229202 RepID=A0ACB7XP02_9ERIC|nr:hypothetical protein Vadar_006250 [Vaccinium darrowii]
MNLHGYPVTAVVHANQVLLPIHRNPSGVHGQFPLLLVGRVHEDLAKDLVEAQDVGYGSRCFRTPIGCSLGSGRCGYVGVRAGCKGSVLGAALAIADDRGGDL